MSAKTFDISGNKKNFGNVKIKKTGLYTHVILHDTPVVSLNQLSNIVTLNSGGWKTPTTRTAINTALRQINGFEKVSVVQKKGEWLVLDLASGDIWSFEDRMIFSGGFGLPKVQKIS